MIPGLLRQAPDTEPAGQPPVVTVHPPGKHSPPGMIASGISDGKRWQAVVDNRGLVSVTGMGGTGMGAFPVDPPGGSDPVVFGGGGSPPTGQALVGRVRRDVTPVGVALGDRAVLTLQPVQRYGHRYVALVVPERVSVAEAIAYSRHGEIRHAIPFVHGGFATFSTWLRPGQTGQRRVTARINTGVLVGKPWSATAYLGPWGDCVVLSVPGSNGSGCSAPGSAPTIGVVVDMTANPSPGLPRWPVGTAAPSVSYCNWRCLTAARSGCRPSRPAAIITSRWSWSELPGSCGGLRTAHPVIR